MENVSDRIIDIITPPATITSSILNRGTTFSKNNLYGKIFEEKTNNHYRLLDCGYTKKILNKKKMDYLCKHFDDKTITFVTQNGFKSYMKLFYNIDLFRCPDEAYIIEHNTGEIIIKILEKKEHNVEDSVEIKLWSGPSLKREYEIILGNRFQIYYGFCVNDFLKRKITSNELKYNTLNKILYESNIIVLFGDDDNYFELLDNWINNYTL